MSIKDELKIHEVETIFNRWKIVAKECESLKFIIQNGLISIQDSDIETWKEYVIKFEKNYRELKNHTYKLIKIENHDKN